MMDRDETKEALKEALKEWLSEREAMVGRWTIRFFLAAATVALCWLILVSQGWHK